MPTKTQLKLDWATHKAARYACENWHYSKSMPTPPTLKIGVWENCKYIGCIIYSRGTAPALGRPYGLKNTELCELTRVALTKHVTPVSRIISISFKMLKKRCPALKLIVSFADTSRGHYGGIYQASNWIYCGMSSKTIEYIDKAGRRWHSRQVSASGFKKQYGEIRKVPKTTDCKRINMPGKHRYLFALDPIILEKIKHLQKPYPKKAREAEESMRHGSTVEIGGASPTLALQNKG